MFRGELLQVIGSILFFEEERERETDTMYGYSCIGNWYRWFQFLPLGFFIIFSKVFTMDPINGPWFFEPYEREIRVKNEKLGLLVFYMGF